MKYFMSLAFALLSVLAVAQDKNANDLMREGDIAVDSKNYAAGLPLYEKAMAVGGEIENEGKLYFHAATCARKLKKYNKAIKYYTKSESLGYKSDNSSYYIAYSYNKLDQGENVEETLVSAIDKYSKSKYIKHMKKMLVNYYLGEGAVPYNEGNTILGSAQPQTDAELAELEAKANVKFSEAKVWFDKAVKYAPTNEKVTATLADIESRLSGEKN